MKTFGLDGNIAVHVLYSAAGVATTVAVENRGGFMLLDCGDGALRDLLDARRLPLGDGDETKLDRWTLRAYAVEHRGSTAAGVGESIPALGYRVGLGEVVVAFSGDTGPGENLRKLCEGADLALIEATWGDRERRLNPRVHLSRAEAEGYGRLAKRFGLIHGLHPAESGD
jgi:L-ascorbate metabolism protein UlaG (beta-lactamase superfamily)